MNSLISSNFCRKNLIYSTTAFLTRGSTLFSQKTVFSRRVVRFHRRERVANAARTRCRRGADATRMRNGRGANTPNAPRTRRGRDANATRPKSERNFRESSGNSVSRRDATRDAGATRHDAFTTRPFMLNPSLRRVYDAIRRVYDAARFHRNFRKSSGFF